MQAKIASKNCKQKLQAKIASKNCKQKLQAKIVSKIWIQSKANDEATMNQKAKVTFFIFFLTETNLWLSPRLVKIEKQKVSSFLLTSYHDCYFDGNISIENVQWWRMEIRLYWASSSTWISLVSKYCVQYRVLGQKENFSFGNTLKIIFGGIANNY